MASFPAITSTKRAIPEAKGPVNSFNLTLPPEIQSIIIGYELVTPILYNCVIIKVPMRWSRLGSLENLVGSDCKGLKYTTKLSIETQQAPLHNEQCEEDSEDGGESETSSVPDHRKIYVPNRRASESLNVLIRLLIAKLTRNNLQIFRWNHNCIIDTATLANLADRQHSSLYDLCLVGFMPREASVGIEGLHALRITSMPMSGNVGWHYDMMFNNRSSLRQLQLGLETDVAKHYARNPGTFPNLTIAEKLRDRLLERIKSINEDGPIFELDLLSLCDINLDQLIVMQRPVVNFDTLTSLSLESCGGLNDLFLHTKGLRMNLKSFTLRDERADAQSLVNLTEFLRSFVGLESLHVLLEVSGPGVQDLSPILKEHGKTLKTLIWDERTGPRDDTSNSKTLLPGSRGHMRAISAYCSELISLGVSLDWNAMNQGDIKLRQCFLKLTKLETLNIRNIPNAVSEDAAKSWLRPAFMSKSLANMFPTIVMTPRNFSHNQFSIKTFALGALTYADVHMGMSHRTSMASLREFLRLRVWAVEYHRSACGFWSPVLDLIAKGKPDDGLSSSHNLDVFEHYWLG